MSETRGSRARAKPIALSWWAWIPAVVAAVSAALLIASAFVPWFTGPDGYARYGPSGSIGAISLMTLVALVLMLRRSSFPWVLGLLTFATTILVLMRLHVGRICPEDTGPWDEVAETCFTEQWGAGSVIFAIGGIASTLASLIAPWLVRYAEDRRWERQRSS